MNHIYREIERCRLCRQISLESVLDLGHQALTGVFPNHQDEDIPTGPLRLVRCGSCGLAQLAHDYNPDILYGKTNGYPSGLNASLVDHLRAVVGTIETRVALHPGDIVLDIGSNDGTLLGSYGGSGLHRIGIDPLAGKFRSFYPQGAVLVEDFFSPNAFRKAVSGPDAKVVTSVAMFYDLQDPLQFVGGVCDVLAADGLWVFEQSYLPKMLETHGYDTICHEHLEYYSMKQIVHIARAADLKIVDVKLNDINGGSFCVTVSKKSAPFGEATETVEALLRHEKEAGLETARPFHELTGWMQHHRSKLRSLLEEIQGNGERILGYGASTKGNVILQYCGIDAALLPMIAEVNEDKFGSCTPGTKIPIISEAQARQMSPDYYLVLPWHFRSGITRKEANYLQRGGRMIFPLPELEIVGTGQVELSSVGGA